MLNQAKSLPAQPALQPEGVPAPSNTAATPGWTQSRERSATPVVRFMLRLSLLLGRRLTRPILHGIAAYFWLFAPQARRHSRAYLRRALGREPRWRERYGHILAFASCIHDRVFWLAGRERVFDIRLSGVEHVLAARQVPVISATPEAPPPRHPATDAPKTASASEQPAPRGIMFIGAHVGSFEALRTLGARHGIASRMLMYEANARKLSGVLAELDPDLPARIIALGRPDAMLRVRDALAAGDCVGALADRRFDQQPGVSLPFLGAPAEFPRGPFQLAALLGVPTVFMAGIYLGGNRYELQFSPLFDFSTVSRGERQAAIAQAQAAYVATLEATCRAHPLNWFNFFDVWHSPSAPT